MDTEIIDNPKSVENAIPFFATRPKRVEGKFMKETPNYAINQRNRTYDAIVSQKGGADFNNIDDAIPYVNALGGGDIFVWGGTYVPKGIMTITHPINIIGQNSALTTINFNSTSNNFVINSGTPYTTGSITSITSGVNVTGSGTSWLANASAGQYIFIGTRWYLIAAVTGNTTLILAEGYSDNVTMPGAAYRIATLTRGVTFEGVTLKNSTGTAIAATDARDIILRDVVFLTNNKAFVFTNVSQITTELIVVASSTSNGIELTNCSLGGGAEVACVSNGGHGIVLNNTKNLFFTFSGASSNTVDGINMTNTVMCYFTVANNGNGGQGVELVSGCDRNIFNECDFANNTSDGIKLTASSDFNRIIGSHFDTNGGWGVNIAVVGDDKNVVLGNSFNANISGTVTDSGTGSVVADNTA